MAVYTEVDDEALATFLDEYDIGSALSCKGIAEGVENSNFLLRTTSGTFILTLYEKRVTRDDLPFFLELMNHLSAKGMSCPVPIKNRHGELSGELAGRPAAIVSFLDGVWVRKPQVLHCAELGRAAAELHLAGSDFGMHRQNDLSVAGWRALFATIEPRVDEIAGGLAAEIAMELDSLDASWPDHLPHGIIHADLFPDNVFFVGDQLSGLIDFYFACNDVLAYDLAICLNAWCFEADGAFNTTKARALIRSYAQARPLSAAEFAALPVLARGAALRFLLTRAFDWLHHPEGAFVSPKDPMEYLRKLRFHRAVSTPQAYGVECSW